MRRVVRSGFLLGALLLTAGAVFLSLQPRLSPSDLLAPFRGSDGALTRAGLVQAFCRTVADCRELDAPEGYGRWSCEGNECTWFAGGRGRCKLKGDYFKCPRGTRCHVDGCGDRWGSCVDVPETCPDIDEPVCGCRRRDFKNSCERLQAGVAHRASEPCDELCYVAGEVFSRSLSAFQRLLEPTYACCSGLREVPLIEDRRRERDEHHEHHEHHEHKCDLDHGEPSRTSFVCRHVLPSPKDMPVIRD